MVLTDLLPAGVLAGYTHTQTDKQTTYTHKRSHRPFMINTCVDLVLRYVDAMTRHKYPGTKLRLFFVVVIGRKYTRYN